MNLQDDLVFLTLIVPINWQDCMSPSYLELFLPVRPVAAGWDGNPHAVRWNLASVSGGDHTVGSNLQLHGQRFPEM